MDYQTAIGFAQTWGLVFLVILFLGVVAYVFWSGNREKFERAARMPLDDDDEEAVADGKGQ